MADLCENCKRPKWEPKGRIPTEGECYAYHNHRDGAWLCAAVAQRNATSAELERVEQRLRDANGANTDLYVERNAALAERDAARRDRLVAIATKDEILLERAAVEDQRDGLVCLVVDLRRRLSEQARERDPQRNVTAGLLRTEQRRADYFRAAAESIGAASAGYRIERDRLRVEIDQLQKWRDGFFALGTNEAIRRHLERVPFGADETPKSAKPSEPELDYDGIGPCEGHVCTEACIVGDVVDFDADYPRRRYTNGACDECDPSFGCFSAPATCRKRPCPPVAVQGMFDQMDDCNKGTCPRCGKP